MNSTAQTVMFCPSVPQSDVDVEAMKEHVLSYLRVLHAKGEESQTELSKALEILQAECRD